MLQYAPHPELHPAAFLTTFPRPLAELDAPELWQVQAERGGTGLVLPSDLALEEDGREELRQHTRDLLRHGGHKPTGRGKPSSEYLVRAATGSGVPRINAAVDACNAVSLETGLPISVVDTGRAAQPFRVDVVAEGAYVFNASGQEIKLDGLLCLFDANGPIANAVKDSHPTKTSPDTKQTLSVIWATNRHAEHAERALAWYRRLLEEGVGATTERLR